MPKIDNYQAKTQFVLWKNEYLTTKIDVYRSTR